MRIHVGEKTSQTRKVPLQDRVNIDSNGSRICGLQEYERESCRQVIRELQVRSGQGGILPRPDYIIMKANQVGLSLTKGKVF